MEVIGQGHLCKCFQGHIKEISISYDRWKAIEGRILSSIYVARKREGIVIRFAFCTKKLLPNGGAIFSDARGEDIEILVMHVAVMVTF